MKILLPQELQATEGKSSDDEMRFTIRDAVESDLQIISTIASDAFQHDPPHQYRFPYIDKYPTEHAASNLLYYTLYMGKSGTTIKVIEVTELEGNVIIIGLAIWNKLGASDHNSQYSKPEQDPRRPDCNPDRVRKYKACTEEIRQKCFTNTYNQRQLPLRQLAIDLAYVGKGVGTALLKEGLARAKLSNLAITLFTDPKTKGFYEKFGFKLLCAFNINFKGEKEVLQLCAMAWDPLKLEILSNEAFDTENSGGCGEKMSGGDRRE